MTSLKNTKAKRVVRYQESVISYLDILGFKALVATKPAGEISRILRILKESVAPSERARKNLHFRIQHFSDLAVRVLPVLPGGGGDLFFELLNLVHVQTSLIQSNIFIRGGITFGEIVRSWGLLYGPGLVRAYQLEQQAEYPRIIVDPTVLGNLRSLPKLRNTDHDFKTEMKYINQLIAKDSDGKCFVDYLRAIETEFDYPEVGYPNFLELHRDQIVSGLNRFRLDRRILSKFRWLKHYHNATVRKRFPESTAKRYLI